MYIEISDRRVASEQLTVEELTALAERIVPLEEKVPSVKGEAFDLQDWYRSWKRKHGAAGEAEPTHCRAEAADEFQALLPWSQLGQALILFAQDGQPLAKGFPIRLYVPDGSSECLNVKSIVKLTFLHDASLGSEASYGFKNIVAIDDLRMKN